MVSSNYYSIKQISSTNYFFLDMEDSLKHLLQISLMDVDMPITL